MIRMLAASLILVAATAFADVSVGGPSKTGSAKAVKLSDGLVYYDLKVGTGAVARPGMQLAVHYTGWLLNGRKFDSSVDRGQPFQFVLGRGWVIKGWDEGVAGMRVGGKRQLHIPPGLAYGARGAGAGLIPPNATLIFDVELLSAK